MKCVLALVMLFLAACAPGAKRVTSPSDAAPDYTFKAEPPLIHPGESVALRWNIPGATKVVIEEVDATGVHEPRMIGTFDGQGQLQLTPAADTTYVLSCEGSKTVTCVSASVRVRVQ